MALEAEVTKKGVWTLWDSNWKFKTGERNIGEETLELKGPSLKR